MVVSGGPVSGVEIARTLNSLLDEVSEILEGIDVNFGVLVLRDAFKKCELETDYDIENDELVESCSTLIIQEIKNVINEWAVSSDIWDAVSNANRNISEANVPLCVLIMLESSIVEMISLYLGEKFMTRKRKMALSALFSVLTLNRRMHNLEATYD